MYHDMRWTVKKIGQRIQLVDSLVHRRTQPIGPFRYKEMPAPKPEGPVAAGVPVAADVDDGDWQKIPAYSHWGKRYTDFVLRTEFAVPAGWTADGPVALYLPLGEPGDFSHPEALAYADGVSFAACDRHHQEIPLPPELSDGAQHLLALHGWTGLIESSTSEDDPGLYMKPCAVVLIDQPTRDFVATARVAHGIAENLPDDVAGTRHVAQRAGRRLQAARPARALRRRLLRQRAESPRRTPIGHRQGRRAHGRQHRLHRPRPHRCRLEVDAWPDAAQGRPHLPHRPASHGAVPGLSLHPKPAPTLRLRAPGLPGALRSRSANASPTDAGRPSAECGWRPTATCPARNRWRASSCWAAPSSASTTARWIHPCSGCRTSSATLGTCRNSSRKRVWTTSSPSRSAGASTTACPMTASGGRDWTAPRC